MPGYRDAKRQSPVAALLLRPEEAAGALNISRTAVYGLIASGELPSITIGRRRRIPHSAVEEYISALLSSANVQSAG